MRKARFKTKLSRRQRVKNTIWLISLIVVLMMATIWFFHAIGEGADWPWNCLETYLVALFSMLFISSLLLFPNIIIAAVLGLQRGRARIIRDNVAFTPVTNIKYYMDNLEQIEPFIVSILIDLDLCGTKDVVATLLRMKRNGIIEFADNGKIKILRDSQGELNDSERGIIQLIKRDKLSNKKALKIWKEKRFREASKRGYIQKKDISADEKRAKRYVVIALIGTLISFAMWGSYIGVGIDLFEGPFSEVMFLMQLAWIAASGLVMGVPWYLAFRQIAYVKRDCITWERTAYGNEKAEKIAGLRRFIQDYSYLSEKEKEHVFLWDDYLLYAIVLEENDKIIKDITRNYKIKI